MTEVFGVLGAGTMGAGIAQVALANGHVVRLYDVAPAGLARAGEAIGQGLAKLVEKGKLEAASRDAALSRFHPTIALDDLADCTVVVEAAPEDMGIKRALFEGLDRVCAPDALLATNTSSLSVTAIAATTRHPERVVGLHFFNPAPLMALVEVVRGRRTSQAAAERAFALAEALGKTPIHAQDTPGFVVNRVARSFYGEALRLVGDHGAEPAAVDRALVRTLGFKMGPFALMDLIGIDVNLAVSESVWRAFYEEPRFRPHPLQRAMVDAGRLGKKTGGGFFDAPAAPPAPASPSGPLRIALAGAPSVVAAWAGRFSAHGHRVDVLGGEEPPASLAGYDGAMELGDAPAAARADRRAALAAALPPDAWLASDDAVVSAEAIAAQTGRLAWRVSGWPQADDATEVALPETMAQAAARVAGVLAAIGREAVFVPDLPGLVGPRTLATLVNEAAFAVEAGVAAPAAIDLAMRLGTGYPQGPLAWGDEIGPGRVVALLQAMRDAFGERYRPAPWLVRRAAAGLPLAGD